MAKAAAYNRKVDGYLRPDIVISYSLPPNVAVCWSGITFVPLESRIF